MIQLLNIPLKFDRIVSLKDWVPYVINCYSLQIRKDAISNLHITSDNLGKCLCWLNLINFVDPNKKKKHILKIATYIKKKE